MLATQLLPEFQDYIDGGPDSPQAPGIQAWLTATANAGLNGQPDRKWCVLDLPGLTEEDLALYFDRTALGAAYSKAYETGGLTGKPWAFLQMESDLIFALHKGFAARHRGRLMTYRDASAQKAYHVHKALSLGVGKFNGAKMAAEKSAQSPQRAPLV